MDEQDLKKALNDPRTKKQLQFLAPVTNKKPRYILVKDVHKKKK